MQQTMKTFAMEMEKAGIQSEMMSDAFEIMMDPMQAADAEDVYNGVLSEIGLEYVTGQPAIPSKAIKNPNAVTQEEDLETRVAALQMAL